MSRVLNVEPELRALSPGVYLDQIKAGGKDGPDGVVRRETPGGQTWMNVWKLGTPHDDFQLGIPDVRMPANQYWPLHWHDCWVAVILLDGECLIGDWWMQPGDVLIARAGLEYGPVMPGPSGCQMFEIFAQFHMRQGGYAPEYRDHPTLEGQPFEFQERSPLNSRNDGRQILPVDGTDGLIKGRLTPGAVFDLGEATDPERGVMLYTELQPGQKIAPHSYGDARMMFVLEGDLTLGERPITKDAGILIERDAPVAAIKAGAKGARLLEVTRTSAGVERRPA